MRRTKKVTREVEVVDATLCDVCGEDVDAVCTRLAEGSRFYRNDVRLEHRYGTVYPDGGDLEALDLDICGRCFAGKVLPALRALGVTREYRTIEL